MLAQADTTKKSSWISFLGKNLNPGISAGIGGARPYGLMPQPTIKLGRFEFEMSPEYCFSGSEYVYSAQIGIEAIKMRGYKGKPVKIVASIGGFTKGYETSKGGNDKVNFAILAGLNQQLTKRSRLSLKIGVLHIDYSSYDNSSHPTKYTGGNSYKYPYGELSYRMYALPFGERKSFSFYNANKNIKKKDKETVLHWHSKYFNPRISLGVGATHPALFGPTFGVKIGRLDVGVGLLPLGGELEFSMNGDIEILKIYKKHEHPSWITVGASVIGSYNILTSFHAGLKNYYNHRSFSLKIGIGSISHYHDHPIDPPSPNTLIPTLDLSCNLYAYKFRK